MLLLGLLIVAAFLFAALGFAHAAWGMWLPATFWLGVDATALILSYNDSELLYPLSTGTILAWVVVFSCSEHFTQEFHGK